MFKKILVLSVCLASASSAFAGQANLLYSDKQRSYAYKALTYIATAEVPPPVTKAVYLDRLHNSPADVLTELCYYAGGLQWRLHNVFNLHPHALQALSPLRENMQSLMEKGQRNLRDVCAVNAENGKLTVLQRITNVQNAIYEITSEAINLRNTTGYRH